MIRKNTTWLYNFKASTGEKKNSTTAIASNSTRWTIYIHTEIHPTKITHIWITAKKKKKIIYRYICTPEKKYRNKNEEMPSIREIGWLGKGLPLILVILHYVRCCIAREHKRADRRKNLIFQPSAYVSTVSLLLSIFSLFPALFIVNGALRMHYT